MEAADTSTTISIEELSVCVFFLFVFVSLDAAYIESQGADQPFFICTIQEFRRVSRV